MRGTLTAAIGLGCAGWRISTANTYHPAYRALIPTGRFVGSPRRCRGCRPPRNCARRGCDTPAPARPRLAAPAPRPDARGARYLRPHDRAPAEHGRRDVRHRAEPRRAERERLRVPTVGADHGARRRRTRGERRRPGRAAKHGAPSPGHMLHANAQKPPSDTTRGLPCASCCRSNPLESCAEASAQTTTMITETSARSRISAANTGRDRMSTRSRIHDLRGAPRHPSYGAYRWCSMRSLPSGSLKNAM